MSKRNDMRGTRTLTAALMGLPLALLASVRAEPVPVLLAEGGAARFSVVVATGATARVHGAATNLAGQLARITGAPFAVVPGDGLAGLAVGVPGDFPKLEFKPDFHPDLPTGREDYLLRSHNGGVYLLGATELAVEHAVWDFLYRLGFRQFFPGPHWEIVPSIPRLEVSIDTLQRPDYNSRMLSSHASYGGPDAYGDAPAYRSWMQRNRIAEGWRDPGGHVYGFIIRARQQVFDEHPEYLALVDGKRQGRKFCVSNPDLRRLVVAYALEQLAQNPAADAVSMEPSDGGGFCECAECARIGSISSQVVLLANEVAEAVGREYPGKYVSILAYNFHTAPPEIRLHPMVDVTVCAGQLIGNWKPNDLFEAWTAMGANATGAGFGVFEYYSNIAGNRFLPGGPRVSDIAYLRRSITGFHQRGARRLRSGTTYSNGTVALGAYLASRMLWDLGEADRLDVIYADFLDKAFAAAAAPMDQFFRLIYQFEGAPPRLPLTDDTIGRLYRALQEALPLAGDGAVRRRIRDLILYTRYAEMRLAADRAPKERRGEAFGDAMRHAWRIRETMMVNVYGLFAYPPKGYPAEEVHWRVPSGQNPWKVGELHTDAEIDAVLAAGVANNPVGTYATRAFSGDLVPAAAVLGFEDKPLGRHGFGLPPSWRQEFFTWVDRVPGTITLRVAGGFIYPSRASNVEITLYSDKAASDAADLVVATDSSVPPDQQEHIVELKTPYAGLHRIEVEGGPGASVLPGVSNMAFTAQAGPHHSFNHRHMWDGWFYVPTGTRQLSFHVSEPSGEVFDGAGHLTFSFQRPWKAPDGTEYPAATAAGYQRIDVPPGQDGCLWQIGGTRASWLFLNVPPYVARRPFELLLPREVVEADAAEAGKPDAAEADKARP